MHIGVVGSRVFPQLKQVEWFIKDLPDGITIVSGGAKGVDQYAKKMADKYGLKCIEYLPDLSSCKQRIDYINAYYARNQEIVDNSDMLVAFTEKDKGGTWNTIKKARQSGIPIKIIRPSTFFPGEATEHLQEKKEKIQKEKIQNNEKTREKGNGPFQIKRIGLGSYALRLKRYLGPIEWADFINAKDNNPEKAARQMIPDFLKFFTHYKYGKIDYITQAPKSIRNLGKLHPMDLVCKEIAEKLNVEYIEVFKPRQKDRRSVHAETSKLEVKPEVKNMIGKVVYILDDVTTSNRTLKSSVDALFSLEIHAHGLAWLFCT